MAVAAQKLMTAEEFARLPAPADGSRQELVCGKVVSMPPPGFRHGFVQGRVYGLLDQYARPRKAGRVVVEVGVITERDPDKVRAPDVSYWSAETLPLDLVPEGYPDVPADLCVEILLPDKKLPVVRVKIKEYFARGVKRVWVVDPDNRTVTVYTSPDQGRILHESAALSGEDVMPGFSCQVAEIFS
jgi:Uma2 family endonuclease